MNKKKKSIQETQNRIRQKIINETEEEDTWGISASISDFSVLVANVNKIYFR